MNYVIITTTVTLAASLSLTAQNYTPLRYEALLNQSITALRAKLSLLEKKIAASKTRQTASTQEQASQKKLGSIAKYRTQELSAINLSTLASLEAMESTHKELAHRIHTLTDKKAQLAKNPIAAKAQEDTMLRRLSLEISVDELEQSIREALRTEQSLEKQQASKNINLDAAALAALKEKLHTRRTALEQKLSREKQDLLNLK